MPVWPTSDGERWESKRLEASGGSSLLVVSPYKEIPFSSRAAARALSFLLFPVSPRSRAVACCAQPSRRTRRRRWRRAAGGGVPPPWGGRGGNAACCRKAKMAALRGGSVAVCLAGSLKQRSVFRVLR